MKRTIRQIIGVFFPQFDGCVCLASLLSLLIKNRENLCYGQKARGKTERTFGNGISAEVRSWQTVDQCFLNFSVHRNLWENMLKHRLSSPHSWRFWWSWSRAAQEPALPISNVVQADFRSSFLRSIQLRDMLGLSLPLAFYIIICHFPASFITLSIPSCVFFFPSMKCPGVGFVTNFTAQHTGVNNLYQYF